MNVFFFSFSMFRVLYFRSLILENSVSLQGETKSNKFIVNEGPMSNKYQRDSETWSF